MTLAWNPGRTGARRRGWVAAAAVAGTGVLVLGAATGATFLAEDRGAAGFGPLRLGLLAGGILITAVATAAAFASARARWRAGERAEQSAAELRIAEQRSREQADLLAAILDAVGDGVGVVDHDGQVLLHNPAAMRLVGSAGGSAGTGGYRDWYGLFEPDGLTPLPPAHDPVALALAGRAADDADLVIRNDQRPEAVPVRLSARALTDGRGRRAALVVLRDRTPDRRSQDELTTVRAELAETRAELAGLQAELTGVQAERTGGRAQLDDARAELADVRTELAETTRRLDAILTNATASVSFRDLEGRFVAANAACANNFGVPQEELLGRRDLDLVEPHVAEQLLRERAALLAEGRPKTFKLRQEDADGDRELIRVGIPLRNAAGEIDLLCWMSLDVTELSDVRRELAATRARYEDLAEHGSVPLALIGLDDAELPLRYVNPAAGRLYGAGEPDEVLGTSLLAWLPGDARAAVQQRVTAVAAGTPARWQMPVIRLDGQARVIEARAVAAQFEGAPAVQLELFDITEQAVAEDALRLSEERIRASFVQAPIGQMEATLDSVIVAANSRLEDLLGYGPGELVGRRVFDLVPPKERPRQLEDLHRLTTGQVDHFGARRMMRRRDGSILPAEVSCTLVRDAEGVPRGYVGMLLDMSEQERADADAAAAERMLTASQRLANVGSWEVDPGTGRLTGSDQLHTILGTTPQDLTRVEDLLTHIVIDDRHAFVDAMSRAERRGGSWTAEGRLALAGERRSETSGAGSTSVRAWGEYVLDDEGRVRRGWGAMQDVTALRHSEQALREARDLFAGVLDAATEQAIVAADEHGSITMFNRGAERMLGWTQEQMVGRELTELLEEDEVAARATELGVPPGHQVLTAVPRTGQAETRRWTYVGADGGRHKVLLTATAQRGPSGRITGFITVAADVSAQVRAERAMQASEQRFRLAFDDSLIGMALVDVTSSPGGRLLRVNRSLSRLIGYSGVELVGADLASLTHADDRAATLDALEQLSSGTLGTWQTERRFRHADGHDLWCRVVMSAVHTDNGDVDYCVAQLEDISSSKRDGRRDPAALESDDGGLHDSLTGLASRGLVLEHLTAALARAARTDRHAALLYVDVDRFAEINDELGRQIGDELLAAIGRRLASCLRDGDVAGHVGGDAFAVVCSDLADPQEVAAVAERIEHGLNALFLIRDHPLAVTVSTGIAISAGRTSAPDLMHEAVGAMYRAKEAGRGRYEIADPVLQARAHRATTVEAQLRDALERDELVLHYQPVFDLRSQRLVAVEALLRWRHPRRGLLRPAEFLDVAESRDLIVPVGEHVLDLACAQGAKWVVEHEDDAPQLWVNVSGRQLARQGFAEQLARHLDETGLPPDKITIELAERQLPGEAEAGQIDLRRLPELGVHLSIDDFGTGHAGMEYLRRLPLDTLKIDRSFVEGLGSDRTRTAMTRSMITLAKSLDLTVVAEGVETPQQRVELIDLGCDLAQGYLLGHPQPAEAIDELLTAGAVARPS